MYEDCFEQLEGADALTEYVSKYRRSGLPDLQVSPPFDLYPSQPVPSGIHPKGEYKDSWPNNEKAGVYMLYTNALKLLYIGKTSMNQGIGHRLSTYFGNGTDTGGAAPTRDWLKPARFVVTIAVPDDMRFEAPMLEEFLIWKLSPPANEYGKRRR
jgi:hypothetical protein